MRLVHTADWHLGHTLCELERQEEHARFLAWLLDVLDEERADALLIAGDVFDTANPPAYAQQQYYAFLAEARRRQPSLDLVIIGGNHDSAARLDAPHPVLDALGVHVIGALPEPDARDRLFVPLHDTHGRVAALVCAVPFLRPVDLPPVSEAEGDRLVEGVRRVYREVLEAARAQLAPDVALVAMGHCYMTGTQLSELSERKILGGNQHALPVDVFPEEGLAYVALGHLHLAQRVGEREHVRYSGSPIPLAFDERTYPHQVAIVDLEGARFAGWRARVVPRSVEFLRVPAEGAATPKDAVAACAALPVRAPELADAMRPYLEVHVRLEGPEPGLRAELNTALEGKAARLLKLVPYKSGDGVPLADARRDVRLHDLQPDEVLRRLWAREHGGEAPSELVAAFHEIVETQAQREDG